DQVDRAAELLPVFGRRNSFDYLNLLYRLYAQGLNIVERLKHRDVGRFGVSRRIGSIDCYARAVRTQAVQPHSAGGRGHSRSDAEQVGKITAGDRQVECFVMREALSLLRVDGVHLDRLAGHRDRLVYGTDFKDERPPDILSCPESEAL